MGEFEKTGIAAGTAGMGVTVSEETRKARENRRGGVELSEETRDLWKRAASCALSGGQVTPAQAAQDADHLVDEFARRFHALARPPFIGKTTGANFLDPANFPNPQPGKVYAMSVDLAAPELPEVLGMWPDPSGEPLDIIEANECNGFNDLATSRFRRCFNEISRLTELLNRRAHGK